MVHKMTKAQKREDLEKEIRLLQEAKFLAEQKVGQVSVSYDTKMLVLCDYLDALIGQKKKMLGEK